MTLATDPVDALVWILFSLRVGLLAVAGAALALIGYNQPRLPFFVLGVGLLLCSLASYFWRHPTRPSRRWFVTFGISGLVLSAIGFVMGAA